MDISSWDGTLSSNDFFLAACTLVDKWKKANPELPPWTWVHSPRQSLVSTSEVEGYLSMENVLRLTSSEDGRDKESCIEEEEANCSDEEDITDCATLVLSNHHQVKHYDFHIVYSASYRVPVLYFRAYHSEGEPMVLEEIEKDLPSCSSSVLLESKWTFITQEEHPYMNQPWYKLHPCGTSEWMKLLFLGDGSGAKRGVATKQYLTSWLSVVGQAVGLRIPLELLIEK